MSSIKIESHDDDSVTLTAGDVEAHICAASWREANAAAHALGAWVTARDNAEAARFRLQRISGKLEEVRAALGVLEDAIESATSAL